MSFVSVAIGTTTAISQYTQGQTNKAMGALQKQSDNYQASQVEQASLDQAQLIRKAGRYQLASADAGYAAAGVRVGQGSAAETDSAIEGNVTHDIYQTILSGTKQANALRADGSNAALQGQLAASNATSQAFGTVLSTGYNAMRANGWRTAGPGFSGTQAPAPVVDRSIKG